MGREGEPVLGDDLEGERNEASKRGKLEAVVLMWRPSIFTSPRVFRSLRRDFQLASDALPSEAKGVRDSFSEREREVMWIWSEETSKFSN